MLARELDLAYLTLDGADLPRQIAERADLPRVKIRQPTRQEPWFWSAGRPARPTRQRPRCRRISWNTSDEERPGPIEA
ncbi:hypothetical protein ACTMTI_05110 [Nonomuraea sp. H19]|uniref:hypothetical protein n=1 Tax=Nonomuraea sp. H19 TaxID=3452206 RepID=UPI003F8A5858